ncbi:transposase [Paenibacillus sp. GCM10012307]|uniref:Helix-turn-helix domain-containing protein n=1 Tax=Paenibacillus roseus TaxID=2798579 RepID=A0A934J6R4_9BACL|nr:helix-turn-helix domain-containing protein [Paenibacillus roseus]
MKQVNEKLKQSIVQRMLPPNNESVSGIAKESGLSETTLYKWKKAAKAQGKRRCHPSVGIRVKSSPWSSKRQA